ncbi:hypothetical protein KUV73_08540 [Mameliella alba]|nr:hypothetical protein [Mameliella alba]MBY6174408.1 hypothetical protein [Mameliella alba]
MDGTRVFHVNPMPIETNKALDYSVLQIVGGDASAAFGALELFPPCHRIVIRSGGSAIRWVNSGAIQSPEGDGRSPIWTLARSRPSAGGCRRKKSTGACRKKPIPPEPPGR